LKYSVRQTTIAFVILVWLRTLGIQKVQHAFPRIVTQNGDPSTKSEAVVSLLLSASSLFYDRIKQEVSVSPLG